MWQLQLINDDSDADDGDSDDGDDDSLMMMKV